MLEKTGEYEESIEYYIKASNDENSFLEVYNEIHIDPRLEISKVFILCLVNLKLVLYYNSKSEYEESQKYFVKSLEKLVKKTKNTPYTFQFRLKNTQNPEDLFSYIEDFILYSPVFKLTEQPHLPSDLNLNREDQNYNNDQDEQYLDIIFINDPSELFEMCMNESLFHESFISTIEQTVKTMDKILYTPPYCILFGRISIEKSKTSENLKQIIPKINEDFYKGFEI